MLTAIVMQIRCRMPWFAWFSHNFYLYMGHVIYRKDSQPFNTYNAEIFLYNPWRPKVFLNLKPS